MNTMIKLEQIKRTDNIVYATVTTVEAHPQTFEIGVDLSEKRLIKNTLNKIDTNVGMAMAKLIKLSNEYGDKLPKKEVSAWY